MVRKNLIMHYSLFAGIVAIAAVGDACAAVRIGNATRNNYYEQQMIEQQRAAQIASTNDIARMSGNVSTNVSQDSNVVADSRAEACSAIYPNGEFKIARPTAGTGVGGAQTCVSVVELRGYQMGKGGADAVLARANVAAGTAINCNISAFPDSTYLPDAANVIFPSDREPTVDDVKQVMNQEQKQNAGLKIAAATLVGAIGGNIAGKNDVGKDGLIGTDKGKLQGTLVGALGGAAIGAGGAYAGKVGGDMIMSAGINAAAGGVVGNIAAAGDSVLRIEDCVVNDKPNSCLWGYMVDGPDLKTGNDGSLCADGKCNRYYIDLVDGSSVMRCDENDKNCQFVSNLVAIYVQDTGCTGGTNILGKTCSNALALTDLESRHLEMLSNRSKGVYHIVKDGVGGQEMESGPAGADGHTFGAISSAKIDNGRKAAMIPNFRDSAFGKKQKDWNEWQSKTSSITIYFRNNDGSIGEVIKGAKLANFYPMYVSAEDGGIIDLGNKARLKSTLIGAGAGGALGAFTAYQGAQSDIDERWVSAVREYKDSLQKFYCITGSRFLSYYNDVVVIPNME